MKPQPTVTNISQFPGVPFGQKPMMPKSEAPARMKFNVKVKKDKFNALRKPSAGKMGSHPIGKKEGLPNGGV